MWRFVLLAALTKPGCRQASIESWFSEDNDRMIWNWAKLEANHPFWRQTIILPR